MRYLADSTFVIDCLTHQPYTPPLLPDLLRQGRALSFIAHMELWDGVYGSTDPRAVARHLRNFLRHVSILPFSHRVSLRTAQLRHEMRGLGLRIDRRLLDILIAGTALTYGLTMVTSDADYDDIPELTRFDPRATSPST